MKRLFTTIIVIAFLSLLSVSAQQISVVDGAGSTSVFKTLDEALSGATDGSTIYLPGGGFKIKDDTKITKKVTILGIGHKVDTDNADGNTTLSGNVNFASGSDGSAIMGVYMSNDINIGVDGKVDNVLVRYCNANSVQVKCDSCTGVFVNQNYLRSTCVFGNSNATISNNVVRNIQNVKGGVVEYNIITDGDSFFHDWSPRGYYNHTLNDIQNSTIRNNICRYETWNCSGSNSANNHVGGMDGMFIKNSGVSTTSDFHFSESYDGDTDLGIYAGTGFSDDCLPPMPRIVSKSVAEQTDAQGKLKVQITVKSR